MYLTYILLCKISQHVSAIAIKEMRQKHFTWTFLLRGSKEANNWRNFYKKMKIVLAIAIIGALFSLGYCGDCDDKNVPYQSNNGGTWTINIYVKQCKYILFHVLIKWYYVCICVLQFVSFPQLHIRPALKILMLHIHAVFIMMMEAVAIHFME